MRETTDIHGDLVEFKEVRNLPQYLRILRRTICDAIDNGELVYDGGAAKFTRDIKRPTYPELIAFIERTARDKAGALKKLVDEADGAYTAGEKGGSTGKLEEMDEMLTRVLKKAGPATPQAKKKNGVN